MNIIQITGINEPTSLWIASRYLESISFFIASFFIKKKKINELLIFAIYFIITFLLITSIINFNIFPLTYIKGKGLTLFKITSEYLIILFLIVGFLILRRYKKSFDRKVYLFIMHAIIFTVISEFFFTLYYDPHGFYNQAGHFFKIISFYFLYKALIETGFKKPYKLFFRELKQNEQELEKKNQELKQVSLLKDEFISIASHDLRAPFNGILGFCEILIHSEELTPENKYYVEQIENSAKTQLSYINSILELVIKGKGEIELTLSSVYLNEIINQSVNALLPLAQKKNIELTANIDFKDKIKLDRDKMIQVSNNLINNAIKFTARNGNIKITCYENPKEKIEIHVIDNGMGIPHSKLPNLFIREKQESKQGTFGEAGSGMGLSICKILVELHGGTINVNSEAGKGSDFFLVLPKKTDD